MKKLSWIVPTLLLLMFLVSANIRPVRTQLLEPEISVTPRLNSTPTGQEFTVNLTITDVTLDNGKNGLYGWEVDMSFNPSAVEVSDVEEGPFLRSFYPPEMTNTTFATVINNETGIIVVTCYYFPYPPDFGAYLYGSDTLANVTVQVVAPGRCTLDIYKSILNTYYALPLPGRIEPIDHTVKDGFFQYPVGDSDGNGRVDAYDLYYLGKAYGSTAGPPPSANWNPYCDFDKDDNVNSVDLTTLSDHYGET